MTIDEKLDGQGEEEEIDFHKEDGQANMDVDEINCLNKRTRDQSGVPSKEEQVFNESLKTVQMQQALAQRAKWNHREQQGNITERLPVEQNDDILMNGRPEVWEASTGVNVPLPPSDNDDSEYGGDDDDDDDSEYDNLSIDSNEWTDIIRATGMTTRNDLVLTAQYSFLVFFMVLMEI